jgi:hypothetical protein
MSAQDPGRPEPHEEERDEVADVLTALRVLSQKVASPMIRVCLQAAHDDIAHLVGTGAEGEAE